MVDQVASNHTAPGDQYMNDMGDTGNSLVGMSSHKLDAEPARKVLRKLLQWYYHEREIQSLNRLDMAMDQDFYDNIQWDPEDVAILQDRGQTPLVFNETAPMVDWIIGTERRSRVDWKVMPRAEDDVEIADVKTKVMKYVADINHVQFSRSRAFSDAVKSGVGWLDDGVRDDPTQDVLYSKWEDWRNVLYDSKSYELDLSDARYVFRWRWVDEDVALAMFPDRQDQIMAAVQGANNHNHDSENEEDTWYGTEKQEASGQLYASGIGVVADGQRSRIRLIEAQYRMPVKTKVVTDGPLKGAFFNPRDQALIDALGKVGGTIVDKVMMRVHMAVFTESDMLAMGESAFRHNKFSLTPVWCYRRGRDRLPYGVIRRVRDVQQDLNKRASKALFLLNTNQIIADEGAVDDWNIAREEVNRPDGTVVTKPGKKFDIRRDTDAATGQIQMMALDAQSIQKSAGVNNENLGRQTNAQSGEAIKARQLQGSVGTTEPFDNLRFATQIQGEKQLSLCEQFYTEEKVIRLTGAKGAIEWVKVNQPEMQPDGSVRYTNDITGSMADFVVAEQDYSGTLRQVMFESLNQLATRLPPEVAMRLMTIAMNFSDLPNKNEVADQIRKMTGERDANKPMTPEEEQAEQQKQQQQAEAMQMQREMAMTALEEQRAKVREINARAAKAEAEAESQGGPGMNADTRDQIMKIQSQAADQLDILSKQLVQAHNDLAKAQYELSSREAMANKEADTKLEMARIDADAKVRVAEIAADGNAKLDALAAKLDDLTGSKHKAE